ncbi:hypothetical protein VCHC41A1_2651, partial [Vibrio cholerae HC-41A1]
MRLHSPLTQDGS